MSKKVEFVEFVKALMNESNRTEEDMSDGAQIFWNTLQMVEAEEKPQFTDNGKLVLNWMREQTDTENWKAKTIAEGLFISSRTVSGAMRKLVADGYVEKFGADPVNYILTEKGRNVIIED